MTRRHTGRERVGLGLLSAVALGFCGTFANAQEEHRKSVDDLAKAAQNPVADMISVPLQNNFNFNVGPHKQLQNVLNIQPVIPITLNSEWNLITRWITPVIAQPALTLNGEREFGLGDINPSFFFSPKQPTHGVILGHRSDLRIPDRDRHGLVSQNWRALLTEGGAFHGQATTPARGGI